MMFSVRQVWNSTFDFFRSLMRYLFLKIEDRIEAEEKYFKTPVTHYGHWGYGVMKKRYDNGSWTGIWYVFQSTRDSNKELDYGSIDVFEVTPDDTGMTPHDVLLSQGAWKYVGHIRDIRELRIVEESVKAIAGANYGYDAWMLNTIMHEYQWRMHAPSDDSCMTAKVYFEGLGYDKSAYDLYETDWRSIESDVWKHYKSVGIDYNWTSVPYVWQGYINLSTGEAPEEYDPQKIVSSLL